MPATVAMAVAGVACKVADLQFAALMLLGFAAFLRTGEIASIKVSHVHVQEATGDIYVALPATKTSRNRLESVAIQDEFLASLLCEVMETRVSDFFFGGSPAQFRRQLALFLSFLHLEDHNFTGYSLRRGGASHAFANGVSFDHLLVKGRWQSVKTARQYLDSGRAALIQLNFSDRANHRIHFFHTAVVNFCEQLRQKRASRR
eukprot:Skav209303  [mRNA]  locus=scaffold994:165891:166499:+ [translate_table: standard]